MNSKKAITLLVLTTLLLSLVPVVSVNAAIGFTTGAQQNQYDKTIVVKGDGVVAGKNVRLYWDLVQDWDGEAGLLNSSKAKSSGAWEIWFDVPEATTGTHYIHVEDSQTLDVESQTFTVIPRIKLSKDAGLDGDKITVSGYGFGSEKDVALVFNGSAPDALSNTTIIAAASGNTEESGTLDVVPIMPGTVELTNGTSIWDNGDGTFGGTAGDWTNGTIDYVTGEWTVTFKAAYGGAAYDINYNAWYDIDETQKSSVLFSRAMILDHGQRR
jgi:hypothetical protein